MVCARRKCGTSLLCDDGFGQYGNGTEEYGRNFHVTDFIHVTSRQASHLTPAGAWRLASRTMSHGGYQRRRGGVADASSDTLAEGSGRCQGRRAPPRFESSWRGLWRGMLAMFFFLDVAGGSLGLGGKRCLGTELTASDGLQTNGILAFMSGAET